jgi:hypothetical protein
VTDVPLRVIAGIVIQSGLACDAIMGAAITRQCAVRVVWCSQGVNIAMVKLWQELSFMDTNRLTKHSKHLSFSTPQGAFTRRVVDNINFLHRS